MKMRKIYKPNYQLAEEKAYELLYKNNVNQLPVKVKSLAKELPNLKIMTYTKFAKKWNLTHKEVCEFAQSDDGCCVYIPQLKSYFILYNDKIKVKGRKRWTIAHELGHYIMEHSQLTNRGLFARDTLTAEEYDVYEKEANAFARTLLAPPPVLRKIGVTEPKLIKRICHLSEEAAQNVFKFIQIGLEFGVTYKENNKVLKLFSGFINRILNNHQCQNCGNVFSWKNPTYCLFCGTQGNLTFYIKEVEKNMFYNGVNINEYGKVFECPRCGNEQIIGDHCHICGVYLINKCTTFNDNVFYDQHFDQDSINWKEEHGCEHGNALPGNARYCPHCGNISTFYAQGLLKSWYEVTGENNKQEKESQIIEDILF